MLSSHRIASLRIALRPTPRLEALAACIGAGTLDEIDWVLVRGSKTTQEAYDSLRAGLGPGQTLDLGRDVRARHSGYPAMPA